MRLPTGIDPIRGDARLRRDRADISLNHAGTPRSATVV
jgi:hypothetical protein